MEWGTGVREREGKEVMRVIQRERDGHGDRWGLWGGCG